MNSEAHGIQQHEIVVGCVAHLVPVKGHPTLIAAIARVPSVRLLIAGDPLDTEYQTSLITQCSALGVSDRVHFLGGVPDIPAFLAELDVFVLPTWAKWRMEGCPVALMEAMACGLPSIATDIPGSRDLIEHGVSGWIVAPENADSLANAIRELAGSPEKRRALGLAARERVIEHFSIEKEVAAHRESLCRTPRPRLNGPPPSKPRATWRRRAPSGSATSSCNLVRPKALFPGEPARANGPV